MQLCVGFSNLKQVSGLCDSLSWSWSQASFIKSIFEAVNLIKFCVINSNFTTALWSYWKSAQSQPSFSWSNQNHEESLLNKIKVLTVTTHSKFEALLKSTILTSVPINSINNTLLVSRTLIINNRTLWASKKAFASLASYDAVMNAGWLITAHLAWDDFDLSWNEK